MHDALIASRIGRAPMRAHRESLEELYATRQWLNIWFVIDSLPMLWAEAGRDEQAAVLLGHLKANDIHYPLRASRRAAATKALEARTDAAKWLALGAQLDRHVLIAYAVDVLGNEP
jgi:hypothetical protein